MVLDYRFLDIIVSGIYAILNWFGVIVDSLISFPSIIVVLLIILPLSISVIFVVIKILHSFIWGV